MGTDLGKVMKLQRLSEEKIQYLVYQMLKGLKVEHSALIAGNLLLYYLILCAMLIKPLLYSFMTVYPFCRNNSQGKFSVIFPPRMCEIKRTCKHCYLILKGAWSFLFTNVCPPPLMTRLDFSFLLSSQLVFSHGNLQDLKPGNLAINQDCELKVQLSTSW